MLDTIVILIPRKNIGILPGLDWDFKQENRSMARLIRNQSKEEKANKIYMPRIALHRGRFGEMGNLKIEVSLPKLLFDNNLDELSQSNFQKVVEKLQKKLRDIGVIVQQEDIKKAHVANVHFSKNIDVSDCATVSNILSEIQKINVRKTFDIRKTNYTNNGESFYLYSQEHHVIFYDKIADLRKSQAKSIDKNQSIFQKSLFEENKIKEIFRMEVRITHRKKLKKLLEKLGIPNNDNPLLCHVFNQKVSEKVLWYYWEREVKSRSLGLFLRDKDIDSAVAQYAHAFPRVRPSTITKLLGMHYMMQTKAGARVMRGIYEKRSRIETWYRAVKKYEEFVPYLKQDIQKRWVQVIEQQLQEYVPYRRNNNQETYV